jgi:hypothetical protein
MDENHKIFPAFMQKSPKRKPKASKNASPSSITLRLSGILPPELTAFHALKSP